MFALKKNEGFDVLLKLIGESNKTDTSSVSNDFSKDIEKILNSLKLTMKNWKKTGFENRFDRLLR